MTAHKVLISLLSVCLTGLTAQETTHITDLPDKNTIHVQKTWGAIAGIVRNSANGPLADAMVTAAKLDGTDIRTTISNSDGIYSFSNVPPGSYSITAQADGHPDAVLSSVEVSPGHATRTDIAFAGVTGHSTSPVAVGSNAGGGQPPVLIATTSRDVPVPEDQAPKPQKLVLPPQSSKSGVGPSVTPQSPATGNTPEALQTPASPAVDLQTPFAFADFTWLNGTSRNKDTVLNTTFFTPEIRFDTHYIEDFNQPIDHTIVGSTEEFRSGEFQIEQASVGGDFHWDNVRGRILFMMGMFATTTPRNDASPAVGQWDLRDAYRYVSEAYGGYHFNVNHGLNVDAGIFVSYIGLFSYYNFDNWTYQPSYVSSNTPWFFNGVRVQWFPTNKLKIEPWLINGWQSYGKFNGHPGLGGQLLYRPQEWLSLVFNQYGYGQDNLGLPKTQRIHTDDSIEVRYYNNPGNGISKMAFSLTGDAGCQYGGGINCTHGPNQSAFVGWMLYDRTWFRRDKLALTLGGGHMNNPGRYLTLLPPIDGADASTGTPYFTENPGQKAHMWDSTVNLQYMPKEYITWWAEVGYRHADIPYFAGRGGVTPPGGNNGYPQYFTCNSGATAGTADPVAAQAACNGAGGVWSPDLRRSQASLGFGVMVKF